MYNEQVLQDLKDIRYILDYAAEWSLDTEVVWSALKAMKEDPSLTIKEAINVGANEWIK